VTFFLRWGFFTVMPIARFMAGVDCLSFACPAARTFVVDSTTTSVAWLGGNAQSVASDRPHVVDAALCRV
jgi:hypothetical protein